MSRSDLGSLLGIVNVSDTCDVESIDTSAFVRRSNRNPDIPMINRPDVKCMLEKINNNHPSTVIFKAKDHLRLSVSPSVFSEIIAAFIARNTVCQALYIQNMDGAIRDEQMAELMDLLEKRTNIWAVNIGENYEVSKKGWTMMCSLLPKTHVTHLYVSEHIIHIKLKNEMRMHIRANRKKHTLHSSVRNIRVIEQVTHMWWNPINTLRHQLEDQGTANSQNKQSDKGKQNKAKSVTSKTKPAIVSPTVTKSQNKKKPPAVSKAKPKVTPVVKLTKKEAAEARKYDIWLARQEFLRSNPNSTVYWAKSKGGKGGEDWKFHCLCGEQCSSDEHERVHPVGAMYECTTCGIWSHTACVLGNVSQEYLEEEEEVLCAKCRAQNRRQVLRELKELNLNWVDGGVAEHSSEIDDDVEDNTEDNLEDNCVDETDTTEESMTDSVIAKRKGDDNQDVSDDIVDSAQQIKKVKVMADEVIEKEDAEVAAALQTEESDGTVLMPEVTRGDSPSDIAPQISSSPVSPLLSMDMHPTSLSSGQNSTLPTSTTSLPNSSPLPPPPVSCGQNSPIAPSTRSPIDFKPSLPSTSSLQSDPFVPIKKESKPPVQTQSQSQPHAKSQSIDHIGHSSFTLLTSSPLLSNGSSSTDNPTATTSTNGINVNNSHSNDNGKFNDSSKNNGSNMSPSLLPLPPSPLSKDGGSHTLPTLLETSNGVTDNKKPIGVGRAGGTGGGVPSSSAAFDPPMLLQTGNLVPLQDWVSVLTPSSLMTSMSSNASMQSSAPVAPSTSTRTGQSMVQNGNIPSAQPPMTLNASNTGFVSAPSTTAYSKSGNGVVDNKMLTAKNSTGAKMSTKNVSQHKREEVKGVGSVGTSPALSEKELKIRPNVTAKQLVSPISSPGTKNVKLKDEKMGNTQNDSSHQSTLINISNMKTQPITLSRTQSGGGSASSIRSMTPPLTQANLSTMLPTKNAPKSTSASTSTTDASVLSSLDSIKKSTKANAVVKSKSSLNIKVSNGSSSKTTVKAMGSPRSPRSTCKKSVGSPKGTNKKSVGKKAAGTSISSTTVAGPASSSSTSGPLTHAEVTSIIMTSTRASCDMKKIAAGKPLKKEFDFNFVPGNLEETSSKMATTTPLTIETNISNEAIPKKLSKAALAKLKVDTTGNVPLSARGRSMTTGDLEGKAKVKTKSPPKAKKAPKISKLNCQSLDNLAGMNRDGATPIKRPRRSSKGFMFVFGARVYVPADHRVGIITEEKNGGWKYVTYDVTEKPEGSTSTSSASLSPTYESDASNSNSTLSNVSANSVPQPPPPTLQSSISESSVCGLLSSMSVISPRAKTNKQAVGDTKGKWCRACDMREVDIGDMPLPNKADKLMNLSHLHPREPAAAGPHLDLGLTSFVSGSDTDYGFDLAEDGDDLEQDELMLMGRRVAYHHPVTKPIPSGNTKRKRCESLDTGMRGMDSFFDYAMFMNNNLSSGTANTEVEEAELVEDDWKLEIGSFGGVFLDDEDAEGDGWNNL